MFSTLSKKKKKKKNRDALDSLLLKHGTVLLFNPLSDMPILDSSSSTANKDIHVCQMWTNGNTDI